MDVLARAHEASKQYTDHLVGRTNAYVCDGGLIGRRVLPGLPQPIRGCGHFIITVDRAPGVTPFMVECGHCGRSAFSKMYRIEVEIEPTHEWYRPGSLDGLPAYWHEHIANGGLVLRPIEGRGVWLRPTALNLPAAIERACAAVLA